MRIAPRRVDCGPIRAIVVAMFLLSAFGCATTPMRSLRIDRYYPDTAGRAPWSWNESAMATAGEERVTALPVVSAASDYSSSSASSGIVRRFKAGDRIRIYLRDIPGRDEISDQIDENGQINLPLLGVVKVEGMSTSEVEDYLEKKYVEDGYYKRITVIVLADEEEYFVQGEVNRPGRYPLGRGRTLLQAIADAGGYTDYANRKSVEIIRADQVQVYNCVKIEQRASEDPLIKPGDIVRVRRRIAPWE